MTQRTCHASGNTYMFATGHLFASKTNTSKWTTDCTGPGQLSNPFTQPIQLLAMSVSWNTEVPVVSYS